MKSLKRLPKMKSSKLIIHVYIIKYGHLDSIESADEKSTTLGSFI